MCKVKDLWMDREDERLSQLRIDIAHEYGWHLDDDSDKIEEILCEREEERNQENG